MASLFDWSSTAGSNTTVDGININTGMSPGNVDNAFRSTLALIRNTFVAGWQGLFAGTTSGIPVSNGAGTISAVAAPTGTIVGTTDTQTLTNKTLTSPTISGGAITGITDLAIADGGTGASTAAAAFANIAIAASTLGDPFNRKYSDGFTIKGGHASTTAGSATAVNFATPFTTLYAVIPVAFNASGLDGLERPAWGISARSANGFTFNSSSGFTGLTGFDWIAIGYTA